MNILKIVLLTTLLVILNISTSAQNKRIAITNGGISGTNWSPISSGQASITPSMYSNLGTHFLNHGSKQGISSSNFVWDANPYIYGYEPNGYALTKSFITLEILVPMDSNYCSPEYGLLMVHDDDVKVYVNNNWRGSYSYGGNTFTDIGITLNCGTNYIHFEVTDRHSTLRYFAAEVYRKPVDSTKCRNRFYSDTLYVCNFENCDSLCTEYDVCPDMVLDSIYKNGIPMQKKASKNYCLNAGNYKIICIDTTNCQKKTTNLLVIEVAPDSILNFDTLTICKFENCYQYTPDYEICQGINSCYSEIFDINNQLYLSSGPNGKYNLDCGEYEVRCRDTINCIFSKTNLTVLCNDPDTLVQYDTLYDCNMGMCGPYGVNYEVCQGNNSCYSLIIDLTNQVYLGENPTGEYNLSCGEYEIHCNDSINCKFIKTFLTVICNSPDTTISYDTISECSIDYCGPGVNYQICQGTNLCYSFIIDLTNQIYLEENPDEFYNFACGEYEIQCFDSLTCTINRTFLTVECNTPDTSILYDTLYTCDIEFCQPSGVQYSPCDGLSTCYSLIIDLTNQIYLEEHLDGNYSLSCGEYEIQCYDSINCELIRTFLTVICNNPDTTTNYDTLSGCEIGFCEPNGVKYTVGEGLNPCYSLVIDLTNQIYLEENITGEYFLGCGEYEIHFYDSINCTMNRTLLSVICNEPDTVTNTETLYLCENNFCLPNTLKYEACPDFNSCYSLVIDLVNQVYLMENPDHIYNLECGEYEIHCYDSINCTLAQTFLTVECYSETSHTYYDTISKCSWGGESPCLSSDVQYEACSGLNSCYVEVFSVNQSLIIPPTFAKTYDLDCGEYEVRCFDSVNCSSILTHLTVLCQTPVVNVVNDTIFKCNWDENPDCETENILYEACSGINTCHVEVYDIQNQFIIAPTGDNIYELGCGDYTVSCFDMDNCTQNITNLTIQCNIPDTIVRYDTIEYCNLDYCAEYTLCSEPGINCGLIYGLPSDYLIGSVIDEVYCLPEGNYTVHCFNSESCIFTKTFLNVKMNNIDTFYCDETIKDTCQEGLWPLSSYIPSYDSCPECNIIAQNSTTSFSYSTEYDSFILSRIEFLDEDNCKMCIYTSKIIKPCYVADIDLDVYFNGSGHIEIKSSAKYAGTLVEVNYAIVKHTIFPMYNTTFYNPSGNLAPAFTPNQSLSEGYYEASSALNILTDHCGECIGNIVVVFYVDASGNITIISKIIEHHYNSTPWNSAIKENDENVEINKEPNVIDKKIDTLESIFIVPNPANSSVSIKSFNQLGENTNNSIKVTLFNQIGEEVMHISKYHLSETIDISNLPIGIYFVKVHISGRQSILKLIKN